MFFYLCTVIDKGDENEKERSEEHESTKEQHRKVSVESVPDDGIVPDTSSQDDTVAVTDRDEEEKAGDACASKGVEIGMKRISLKKDEEAIECHHHVWRPKRRPDLPSLLQCSSKKLQERRRRTTLDRSTNPPIERSASRRTLFMRQQNLLDRVQAAQAVLKESTDEIIGSPLAKKPNISFKEASRRIISFQRKQAKGHGNFSDIVTQYMARKNSERIHTPRSLSSSDAAEDDSQKRPYKRCSTHGLLGAIPIDEWQKIVEESS